MPESIVLEKKLSSFSVTRTWRQWTIPWEVASYAGDARAFSGAAFFDFSHWATVEIEGPDARDYLNRMTTVSFKTLDPKQVWHGAFLTGRGTVVTLGLFRQIPDKQNRFQYVLPVSLGVMAAEHIEKFHFAEVLSVADRSLEFRHFGLSDEAAQKILGKVPESLAVESFSIAGEIVTGWKHDSVAVSVLQCRAESAEKIARALLEKASLVGLRVWNLLRIKAGVPESGTELTEKEIILEGNYDRAVARNKGCYPGQEVVERIFTYGQVNKKLFPVRVEREMGSEEMIALPLELSLEGKKVGELVSFESDPVQTEKGWGLAFINKNHWQDKTFSTSLGKLTVAL